MKRIPISSSLIVDLSTGNPPPDIQRLKLVACLISGKSEENPLMSPSLHKGWLKHHGGAPLKSGMLEHGGSGSEQCGSQGVQAAMPSLVNVLDYLSYLFEKGLQYRTINLQIDKTRKNI